MWFHRKSRESSAMVRRSRLIRTPHVRATTRDDETVLLDVERGRYYALNEVGSRIWALVCEGVPFAEIVDRVCAEYDVSRERGERDADALIRQLLAESLVRCER
jgi:hypothetical protein